MRLLRSLPDPLPRFAVNVEIEIIREAWQTPPVCFKFISHT